MPKRKNCHFHTIRYLTIIAVLLINYNTLILAQDVGMIVAPTATHPQNISTLNTTPDSDNTTTTLQNKNSSSTVASSLAATPAQLVPTLNITLSTANATTPLPTLTTIPEPNASNSQNASVPPDNATSPLQSTKVSSVVATLATTPGPNASNSQNASVHPDNATSPLQSTKVSSVVAILATTPGPNASNSQNASLHTDNTTSPSLGISSSATENVSLSSSVTSNMSVPPTTIVPTNTEPSNATLASPSSPANSSTSNEPSMSSIEIASTTPSVSVASSIVTSLSNVSTSNMETTATTSVSSTQAVNTTAEDQTTPESLNNSSSAATNKDVNTIQNSTSAGTVPPTEPPPSNKFTIFFVNNMQHDIFPLYPENGSLCETDKDECVGGLSRLGSYIETARASQRSNLWLNVGNMLRGDWFKILKYNATLEAIQYLQFDFVAVESKVFQYGREASEIFLKEMGSKVLISNIEEPDVKRSDIVTFGKCNISVIGFVDDINLQEDSSHGISVSNIMESLNNELNETQLQLEYPSELITIAIGSTSRENANKIANNTDAIDIILYSGNCSIAENSTDYICWDTVNKTDSKTTYVGSMGMKQANITHRFLVGKVEITIGDNCSIENIEHDYFDYTNITRDRGAPNLAKKLFDLNLTLTENTKNLTGWKENCSVSECLLGNLVTDSMLISLKGNDFWNEDGSRIAVFPAIQFQLNKTLPQGNVTAMSLYNLVKDDAYIYRVSLLGKELNEMIHISLNSKLNNKSVDFLHLSGMLHVQYNTTSSNELDFLSVQTVPAFSASMQLEPIDLSDNNTFYAVTMPFSVFKMESYKKLLNSINESRIIYHNVTVIDALTSYIKKEEFVTLPLVGYRQIKLEATPSIPEVECASNTGTTILVTLVITAIFLGGCYGVWWYVFRRNRPRTGSTMAMMNMD